MNLLWFSFVATCLHLQTCSQSCVPHMSVVMPSFLNVIQTQLSNTKWQKQSESWVFGSLLTYPMCLIFATTHSQQQEKQTVSFGPAWIGPDTLRCKVCCRPPPSWAWEVFCGVRGSSHRRWCCSCRRTAENTTHCRSCGWRPLSWSRVCSTRR